MQNRTSLEGSPEEDGDGESDYEPRTEEDSIVANSPDIISEIASEVAEVEGRRCQLENCILQRGLHFSNLTCQVVIKATVRLSTVAVFLCKFSKFEFPTQNNLFKF